MCSIAQKELSKPHVSSTGFSWQKFYKGHTRLATTDILTSLEQPRKGLQWCPLGCILGLWLCLTSSVHYGLYRPYMGLEPLDHASIRIHKTVLPSSFIPECAINLVGKLLTKSPHTYPSCHASVSLSVQRKRKHRPTSWNIFEPFD